jgi:hypothetical protein
MDGGTNLRYLLDPAPALSNPTNVFRSFEIGRKWKGAGVCAERQ